MCWEPESCERCGNFVHYDDNLEQSIADIHLICQYCRGDEQIEKETAYGFTDNGSRHDAGILADGESIGNESGAA